MCGGRANGNFTNACYKYDLGKWEQTQSMKEKRRLAASIQQTSGLLVLGGLDQNARHNTSEILTQNGWENGLPNFPVDIFFQCMVQFNSSHIMVIAGQQNGSSNSSETFIIDTENGAWHEGPLLISGRHAQSCARIHRDSQSNDLSSIIVVGGWNSVELDVPTTEILDQGANEWRQGPELPYGISVSNLVEDSTGGVVLVGGQIKFEGHGDVTADIFRLPNAGADAR